MPRPSTKKSYNKIKKPAEKQEEIIVDDSLVRECVEKRFKDKYGEEEWVSIWRLDCHNVFDDKWRVNMWTSVGDSESVCQSRRISYSFFLAFSDSEGILWSNPEF